MACLQGVLRMCFFWKLSFQVNIQHHNVINYVPDSLDGSSKDPKLGSLALQKHFSQNRTKEKGGREKSDPPDAQTWRHLWALVSRGKEEWGSKISGEKAIKIPNRIGRGRNAQNQPQNGEDDSILRGSEIPPSSSLARATTTQSHDLSRICAFASNGMGSLFSGVSRFCRSSWCFPCRYCTYPFPYWDSFSDLAAAAAARFRCTWTKECVGGSLTKVGSRCV